MVLTIKLMQKKKENIKRTLIKFGVEKLQDYIVTAESGAKTGGKLQC